ncbi:unnamed protein product [Effrenium voratum]|nr:unnamed protein product [Effrenium voratum]CAJ1418813.1 unnamed protein product [Effrenium voratum]
MLSRCVLPALSRHSVRRLAPCLWQSRHFARPVCLSDREKRQLVVRGQNVPVSDEFWEYVADDQSVKDGEVYRNNTENYVGTVKYPIGAIGPLKVNGEYANREYVVPMATHEGALLASYSRGAKAITAGGGVTTRIKTRCMVRAPVFIFDNIADANDFYRWAHQDDTQAAVKDTLHKNIGHLTEERTRLRVFQTDRKVHISVGIDSQDAAGQNKVTYAGDLMMKYMKENYKKRIPEMYIEGGFNAGKRVSVMHTLLGKGHSLVADCIIPKEVCQSVLRTTPYRLQRFQKMHNRTNEFIGGISCTAHVANGLAAFYIATGNDPACTAESQAAVTHFDLVDPAGGSTTLFDQDLYASITLNSIIVASVGGGTQLPAFKAARSMMNVTSANELAEICAGVALSGELSFYASMETGSFADAHWNMTHKG